MMKRVDKPKNRVCSAGGTDACALRQLDQDVVRFVEALAIADARRDHLAAMRQASTIQGAEETPSSQTEARHDSRSHLRPLLD
jgi:hypothetical protein